MQKMLQEEEDDDDRAQIVKLRKVACSMLNISGACADTSIHRRIFYPTALC